jgi:hypothetical protein
MILKRGVNPLGRKLPVEFEIDRKVIHFKRGFQ